MTCVSSMPGASTPAIMSAISLPMFPLPSMRGTILRTTEGQRAGPVARPLLGQVEQVGQAPDLGEEDEGVGQAQQKEEAVAAGVDDWRSCAGVSRAGRPREGRGCALPTSAIPTTHHPTSTTRTSVRLIMSRQPHCIAKTLRAAATPVRLTAPVTGRPRAQAASADAGRPTRLPVARRRARGRRTRRRPHRARCRVHH